MKASTICEFTRQEFIGGLQSIGVDSIEKLRGKLPSLRAELKDDRAQVKDTWLVRYVCLFVPLPPLLLSMNAEILNLFCCLCLLGAHWAGCSFLLALGIALLSARNCFNQSQSEISWYE